MKLEKLLLFALGIRLLISIYYFPNALKSILASVEDSVLINLGHIVGQTSRYFFLAIAVVGLVRYFQDKKILNPFLKIYFIYFLSNFILSFPTRIGLVFKYRTAFTSTFILFSLLALATAILIVLVYRQQKISIASTTKPRRSVRLGHYMLDSIVIILLLMQLWQSYRAYIGTSTIVEVYLFSLIVFLGYYVISESVFQQTIGKVVTQRYVARIGGRKAGFFQIVLRSLARAIPFEPFSLLSSPSIGWHDKLSDTNVYPLADGLREEEDEIMDHLIEQEEI